MRGIADDVPFLFPVSVDLTWSGSARVPDTFRNRQWTRLQGGLITPAFVGQVKQLIEARFPGPKVLTNPVIVPPSATAGLACVSARVHLPASDPGLIFGFVVSGTQRQVFLLRAVGPTLANFGVPEILPDPVLVVATLAGNPLARNAGLADEMPATVAQVAGASNQVGAFALPQKARDAALLLTLPPGVYTALVSSASKSAGQVLVEIYGVRQ